MRKRFASACRAPWLLAAVLLAGVLHPAHGGAQPVPARGVPPGGGIPVSRLDGADSPVLPPAAPMQPRPDQLPPLPVTLLDERSRAADLDGPRTVSLTFSQPMPITEILMLLVRGTAFSVVTDASVAGTFIGELKDLSMRQALEAVLFPQGLDYVVDGTVIRVAPRRPETRLFEVDHVNVQRGLQRRTRATASLDGGVDTQLTSSVDSDIFAEVDAGVKALLSSSGRHHVDRRAGLVHVTDFADRLDRVSAYLDAVHVRATRQVRLDARVLEVALGERRSIDWAAVAARAGGAIRAGAPGAATAGLHIGDLDTLVTAIGEQGAIRLIAAPRLLAMNNEPAVMRAGANEVSFGEADPGKATIVADGLTLTVTPQISADGIVTLNVAPAWAEKTGQVRSREGGAVPLLRLNAADTMVRVRDGEAVVISGGLQERTEAQPSTGFSGFFGAQQRRTVHVELVVLLSATPVVPGVIRTEGVQ